MNFNQLFLFKSKDDLPQDFLCMFCQDICNTPILKTQYDEMSSCDDKIYHRYNKISSLFQTMIKFQCEFCGKLIQYLHCKSHSEQCNALIKNGSLIIEQFVSNGEINQELICSICKFICFKPQYINKELICLFCRSHQKGKTYSEIEQNLELVLSKVELVCKRCNQVLLLEQILIHFKLCLKDMLPETDDVKEIFENKKLRQKMKYYLKMKELSFDEYTRIESNAVISQYFISYQLNKVHKLQKKILSLESIMFISSNE